MLRWQKGKTLYHRHHYQGCFSPGFLSSKDRLLPPRPAQAPYMTPLYIYSTATLVLSHNPLLQSVPPLLLPTSTTSRTKLPATSSNTATCTAETLPSPRSAVQLCPCHHLPCLNQLPTVLAKNTIKTNTVSSQKLQGSLCTLPTNTLEL